MPADKDKEAPYWHGDMWNKRKQEVLSKMSKQRTKDNSCCMHMFETLFKNLIYIFVFVFVFSFVGMCYIVFNSNEDAIFAEETFKDLQLKEWFIENNPLVYGLNHVKK